MAHAVRLEIFSQGDREIERRAGAPDARSNESIVLGSAAGGSSHRLGCRTCDIDSSMILRRPDAGMTLSQVRHVVCPGSWDCCRLVFLQARHNPESFSMSHLRHRHAGESVPRNRSTKRVALATRNRASRSLALTGGSLAPAHLADLTSSHTPCEISSRSGLRGSASGVSGSCRRRGVSAGLAGPRRPDSAR